MDKYVGKRLDGRYEIEEIIGVGGMAVVYKAHDNVENRTVAIKILKDEFVSNDEFIRRFKNESKAIAVLSHPNIVKVYDVSFGDLIQYIVMEYIDGITLKEYIEHQGSLRWKDAVFFTIQILKGLQHAHDKGIVHRDVKPQNIMVLQDGTIKVTDFGIARFSRSEQRTITDKAIGSVHYISPEQARGSKTDEKADIYSVGVILYEMLTGQLPFEAESAVSIAIMQLQKDPKLPTEINSSIPLGLEQITMHAMQKTSERRYQSAAEMLCDLDQFKKDPEVTFDYTYFVDDSPTKFVNSTNVVSSKPASANDNYNYSYDDADEPKQKSKTVPILAGVASALVVAIAVLAILFVPKFFSKTDEIACPNFVGMSFDEVKESEYNDTFEIEFEQGSSEDYDANIVYEQSIKAGKKIKANAKITLKISTGTQTTKVPDVYGMSDTKAFNEIEAKGLKYKVETEENEDVEKDKVIRTDPARTTVVALGTEITVYVSAGKQTKMVEIPDVTGEKTADAEKDLKKAGLNATVTTRSLTPSDSKYMESGRVISQEPKATTDKSVPEGTTIQLYISDGTVVLDVKVSGFSGYSESNSVKLSLWVKDDNGNDKLIATSEVIDTTKIKDYTFEDVKLTDSVAFATLKVSPVTTGSTTSSTYIDCAEYKIDAMSGKATLKSSYTKPTFDE